MNTDRPLFELLRQKRNQIARGAQIKPFMVLQNKVLQAISDKKPATIEELTEIKGMGKKKVVKYGQILLDIINGDRQIQDRETIVYKRKEKEFAPQKVLTVSEYLDLINEIIVPQRVVIQGEVGGISSRDRYTFFSLIDKEDESVLNCFIWQDKLEQFGLELKEGLELKVEGYGRVYKKRGSFTFEAERIGLVGEGVLKAAFEALKKKLAIQGFFAPERKKKIPDFPERVGLITSSYGDAIKDFTTHLGNFGFKIHFFDVRVEGLWAIDDIVSAIKWFNENRPDIDVLVLTRGGGDLESMQAFNSQDCAKAIFGSRIPIVTGIGHEKDETIADLVADCHVSTPTAAARFLSDSWRNAAKLISSIETHISGIFTERYRSLEDKLLLWQKQYVVNLERGIRVKKRNIEYLQANLVLSSQRVFDKVNKILLEFDQVSEKLKRVFSGKKRELENKKMIFLQEYKRWLNLLNGKIEEFRRLLDLSDPTKRLKQGYSIAFNFKGKVIKSVKDLTIGDKLKVKFYIGRATSCVETIND